MNKKRKKYNRCCFKKHQIFLIESRGNYLILYFNIVEIKHILLFIAGGILHL